MKTDQPGVGDPPASVSVRRSDAEIETAMLKLVAFAKWSQRKGEREGYDIAANAAAGLAWCLGLQNDGAAAIADVLQFVDEAAKVIRGACEAAQKGLRPCRRCTECPESKHHFLRWGRGVDGTRLGAFTHVCKHCRQLGTECRECWGDGAAPDGSGECSGCEGHGVTWRIGDQAPDDECGEEDDTAEFGAVGG